MSAAAAIRPDKLLKELDELWVSMGHQSGDTAVLRACAMTLIVVTRGAEDEVGETLATLMRDHPARAIVLREIDGEAHLEAGVRAQCWKPFGSREQICCEMIEITTSRASMPEVPPVVASLTAPDLPIAIWCRCPELLAEPVFEPILRLANKLVLDSSTAPDLHAQLSYIRNAEDADTAVADLAWTRITRWREAIARIFDDRDNAARIPAISDVRIEYEGGRVPMSAYYVAGWLMRTLGRKLGIEFVPVKRDEPRPRLHTVALRAGEDWEVSVEVDQDRSVRVRAGARDVSAIFPRLTETDLLREELAVFGRDPAYLAAREAAAELIG